MKRLPRPWADAYIGLSCDTIDSQQPRYSIPARKKETSSAADRDAEFGLQRGVEVRGPLVSAEPRGILSMLSRDGRELTRKAILS
jgi:hypothetical protein